MCSIPHSRRYYYGTGESQFGDLYLQGDDASVGTIVLVHGGFWRAHRGVEMTAAVASDLAADGWAVWNLEYRRVGQGAFPATFTDCANGIDYLSELAGNHGLPTTTIIYIGHSAGGHLATWAAGRSAARARPDGVLSLGGVLDLRHAVKNGVGEDAVPLFLGGRPEERPARYQEADPIGRLPLGIPVRCAHSRTDERVPFELSQRYVETAARAGDDAALVELPGTHAEVVDPATGAWQAAKAALSDLLPGTGQRV